jgi:hypothetical protein
VNEVFALGKFCERSGLGLRSGEMEVDLSAFVALASSEDEGDALASLTTGGSDLLCEPPPPRGRSSLHVKPPDSRSILFTDLPFNGELLRTCSPHLPLLLSVPLYLDILFFTLDPGVCKASYGDMGMRSCS